MGEQAQDVAVVVVPFTAQSHLAQLLHLSSVLSAHPGLAVHYASSATHILQVKSRLHSAWSSAAAAISFHELPIPAFSSPAPNPHTAVNKFPSHLQPLFEASVHLRAPLSALLRSLSASHRRVVVVHDPLASFAAHEAAALPNAESYMFHCVNAAFQLVFLRPSAADTLKDRGLHLPPLDGIITDEFTEFAERQWNATVPTSGALFNTCRAIEGEFVDLLAQEPHHHGKKLFTIGPLSPLAILLDKGGDRRLTHKCLDWLDKQPPASVVYVSFGTTTAMSGEQVAELANGLLCSGQRFIWVLRDADRGDIYAAAAERNGQMELPPEVQEEVEKRGMVVRGWAPQLEILAHPSTGAFMSHCGWNSCMESLCLGVPVVAWPMHSDQPANATLVTEYLKAGIAVREWTPDSSELVGRAVIGEAIKRAMASEEGKKVRERARALGEAVRAAAGEGGSSRAELDAFVAHITRA